MTKQDNLSLMELGDYFRAGISDNKELAGVYSDLSSPILEMPLKNSLVMSKGTDQGIFLREQSGKSTHFDIHGVLRYTDADTPRFSNNGLLFEGAATNYVTNTSFSTWDGISDTTFNAAVSPDGTTNAVNINNSVISFTTSITTSNYHTFSVWLKGTFGGEVVVLEMSSSSTQLIDGYNSTVTAVDIVTDAGFSSDVPDTIIDALTSAPLPTDSVSTAVSVNQIVDGYDADIISTETLADGGTAGATSLLLLDGETAEQSTEVNNSNLLITTLTLTKEWKRYSLTEMYSGGNPLKVLIHSPGSTFVFGPQVEKGAFMTSFIPTYGTVGTRGSDKLIIEGSNIPHVTAEKTIVLDYTPLSRLTPLNRDLFTTKGGKWNSLRCLSTGSYSMRYGDSGVALIDCETDRTDRITYCQSGGNTSTITSYINHTFITETTQTVSVDVPISNLYIGNNETGDGSVWGYISNLRIFGKKLNLTSLLLI